MPIGHPSRKVGATVQRPTKPDAPSHRHERQPRHTTAPRYRAAAAVAGLRSGRRAKFFADCAECLRRSAAAGQPGLGARRLPLGAVVGGRRPGGVQRRHPGHDASQPGGGPGVGCGLCDRAQPDPETGLAPAHAVAEKNGGQRHSAGRHRHRRVPDGAGWLAGRLPQHHPLGRPRGAGRAVPPNCRDPAFF